jgi:hypothetical protein
MMLGTLSPNPTGIMAVDPLMAACGADPCGFMDALFPSAACSTWQTCAAVANQTPAPVPSGCVVGGLDAFGNTIVSCGGYDAVETPYPVVTSAPCAGMTPEQCAAVTQAPPSGVGIPQWALLGGIVFLAVMIVGRR